VHQMWENVLSNVLHILPNTQLQVEKKRTNRKRLPSILWRRHCEMLLNEKMKKREKEKRENTCETKDTTCNSHYNREKITIMSKSAEIHCHQTHINTMSKVFILTHFDLLVLQIALQKKFKNLKMYRAKFSFLF
jgi:hypothetical protein